MTRVTSELGRPSVERYIRATRFVGSIHIEAGATIQRLPWEVSMPAKKCREFRALVSPLRRPAILGQALQRRLARRPAAK